MLTKNELLLKLALFVNKKLYEEKSISYTIYKKTENSLINKLKKEKINGII